MSKNYDNWERLVSAVVRVERDKQIAMIHSEESSNITSSSSSFTSTSLFDDQHQSLIIHRESSELIPMDYLDLPAIDHREWRMMLPPDKQEVVLRSASMRFFGDQTNGKNCFLFGATNFVVEPSSCWEMKSHPKSSFSEVGELEECYGGFIIEGIIKTQMLTPKTLYAAYLVFELKGNGVRLVNSIVKLFYDGHYPKERLKILHLRAELFSGNRRGDEWMEIELGDFYIRDESPNGRVEVQLLRVTNESSMCGLIVEGIECRPLLKTRGKRVFSKLWISG